MFRLLILGCAVAAACALPQRLVDEKDAKILKEQRFNAGDGRAGAAFATENEITFREETDNAGNRIGQYSYIGEDGQTYTVKYSAGIDGFRILDGAHIPSGGQDAAPFVAEEPLPEEPIRAAPAPAPQPAVRVAPAPRVAPTAAPAPAVFDYEDEPVDPNFNPFINPFDPTHLNFAHNKNGAKFAPKVPGVLGADNVPPCAGCEGLNPFVNPFDASHQPRAQSGLLAGHLAGHLAGAQPQPRPAPVANARPTGRIVPQQPTQFAFTTTTTPAPRRFFPPGQLKLNRFETGFNFDFES